MSTLCDRYNFFSTGMANSDEVDFDEAMELVSEESLSQTPTQEKGEISKSGNKINFSNLITRKILFSIIRIYSR